MHLDVPQEAIVESYSHIDTNSLEFLLWGLVFEKVSSYH